MCVTFIDLTTENKISSYFFFIAQSMASISECKYKVERQAQYLTR